MQHSTEEFSGSTEQKVEHIRMLLEGSGIDSPGVIQRVALIERVMFGKENQEGIVQKVNTLWRIHVWVLCTLSGLAGFALNELVRIVLKV